MRRRSRRALEWRRFGLGMVHVPFSERLLYLTSYQPTLIVSEQTTWDLSILFRNYKQPDFD